MGVGEGKRRRDAELNYLHCWKGRQCDSSRTRHFTTVEPLNQSIDAFLLSLERKINRF